MPALVVAIARAPAFTNSLALTASQALGSSRIGGAWCMARKASACSPCRSLIFVRDPLRPQQVFSEPHGTLYNPRPVEGPLSTPKRNQLISFAACRRANDGELPRVLAETRVVPDFRSVPQTRCAIAAKSNYDQYQSAGGACKDQKCGA